ncbi:DUF3558 domain-containing protein [Paractinoplanes hotanensis]|uniref:DUF3558 domain-containing protein n=1 Tax=Paractinoplanes hotanensis TaxID=2906497 RepID=A0ABT0Y739_9ACTN|nr:DUF3558 domain-containing protein [Actinoplanes hotanensis]MCM4081854.1 DUF3558 domain-containing protein [Actinoplanes hotanensis]
MSDLPTKNWSRRGLAGTAALFVTLVLAGCGGQSTDTPASGAAEQPPATGAAPERADQQLDGCELLTDAEITAEIGDHDGGSPGADGCVWENPANAHSVTLSVGIPGTAAGGELPASDPIVGDPAPGPDGIRFVTGEAEFAAGDRACSLRVVTSVTDDSDRPAMIRLAGLVRERIAGAGG